MYSRRVVSILATVSELPVNATEASSLPAATVKPDSPSAAEKVTSLNLTGEETTARFPPVANVADMEPPRTSMYASSQLEALEIASSSPSPVHVAEPAVTANDPAVNCGTRTSGYEYAPVSSETSSPFTTAVTEAKRGTVSPFAAKAADSPSASAVPAGNGKPESAASESAPSTERRVTPERTVALPEIFIAIPAGTDSSPGRTHSPAMFTVPEPENATAPFSAWMPSRKDSVFDAGTVTERVCEPSTTNGIAKEYVRLVASVSVI